MKKAIALVMLALLTAALAGCMIFNNNAPYKTATPTRWTAPGERTQAISSPKPSASLPPEKTASQDTAGAVTKLPEEATAAGATAGS